MKTVEEYFQDSISRYQYLEQEAILLADEIESLLPEQIYNRCQQLHDLQKEIAEHDAKLIELMKFMGPDILDNRFTGEYQRSLQKAIDASDKVASKAKTIRTILSSELHSLKTNRDHIGKYSSGNKNSGTLFESRL